MTLDLTTRGDQLKLAFANGDANAILDLAPELQDFERSDTDPILTAMTVSKDILHRGMDENLRDVLFCLMYIHSSLPESCMLSKEYVRLFVDLKVKIILIDVFAVDLNGYDLSNLQDIVHTYFDPTTFSHAKEVSGRVVYTDMESYSAIMHKTAYTGICEIIKSKENVEHMKEMFSFELSRYKESMLRRLDIYFELVGDHLSQPKEAAVDTAEGLDVEGSEAEDKFKTTSRGSPNLPDSVFHSFKRMSSLEARKKIKLTFHRLRKKRTNLPDSVFHGFKRMSSLEARKKIKFTFRRLRKKKKKKKLQQQQQPAEDKNTEEGSTFELNKESELLDHHSSSDDETQEETNLNKFNLHLPSSLLQTNASQLTTSNQNSQGSGSLVEEPVNHIMAAPKFFYEENSQLQARASSDADSAKTAKPRHIKYTTRKRRKRRQKSNMKPTYKHSEVSLKQVVKRRKISSRQNSSRVSRENSPSGKSSNGRNINRFSCDAQTYERDGDSHTGNSLNEGEESFTQIVDVGSPSDLSYIPPKTVDLSSLEEEIALVDSDTSFTTLDESDNSTSEDSSVSNVNHPIAHKTINHSSPTCTSYNVALISSPATRYNNSQASSHKTVKNSPTSSHHKAVKNSLTSSHKTVKNSPTSTSSHHETVKNSLTSSHQKTVKNSPTSSQKTVRNSPTSSHQKTVKNSLTSSHQKTVKNSPALSQKTVKNSPVSNFNTTVINSSHPSFKSELCNSLTTSHKHSLSSGSSATNSDRRCDHNSNTSSGLKSVLQDIGELTDSTTDTETTAYKRQTRKRRRQKFSRTKKSLRQLDQDGVHWRSSKPPTPPLSVNAHKSSLWMKGASHFSQTEAVRRSPRLSRVVNGEFVQKYLQVNHMQPINSTEINLSEAMHIEPTHPALHANVNLNNSNHNQYMSPEIPILNVLLSNRSAVQLDEGGSEQVLAQESQSQNSIQLHSQGKDSPSRVSETASSDLSYFDM